MVEIHKMQSVHWKRGVGNVIHCACMEVKVIKMCPNKLSCASIKQIITSMKCLEMFYSLANSLKVKFQVCKILCIVFVYYNVQKIFPSCKQSLN